MVALNGPERRALLLGTALVVAGAAARTGFGPGTAAFGWEEASGSSSSATRRARETAEGGGAPPAEGTAAAALRAAVREEVRRGREAARPLAPDERIDPNRAGQGALERLPGVGPVTARAILEERSRSGPYREVGDLDRVPGIGPVTLRRIAPHVALPDPSPGERDPRVDVNTASPEELRDLPGIGPVLARRIVASRDELGRFRSLDELLRVPGIGPRRLARLRYRAVAR